MANFDERLCLQWNDLRENLSSAFDDLISWEKTRSSLMWPWLVRMVSRWRLTRWFSLPQVPSFSTSWRGTNIATPWSTWGVFENRPWSTSSITVKQMFSKRTLTPSWLWLRSSNWKGWEETKQRKRFHQRSWGIFWPALILIPSEHFSKNVLLRRVEFGIWLEHHRKIRNCQSTNPKCDLEKYS